MDDLASLPWGVINGGTVVSMCVFGLVAMMRGWVVPGPWHQDVRDERDEWRDIALRSLRVSERSVDASEVTAHALAALPEAIEGTSP